MARKARKAQRCKDKSGAKVRKARNLADTIMKSMKISSSITNKSTNLMKKRQKVKRKEAKVSRGMIQQNFRLLVPPQILPKRIRREKFLTRNHNLLRG